MYKECVCEGIKTWPSAQYKKNDFFLHGGKFQRAYRIRKETYVVDSPTKLGHFDIWVVLFCHAEVNKHKIRNVLSLSEHDVL